MRSGDWIQVMHLLKHESRLSRGERDNPNCSMRPTKHEKGNWSILIPDKLLPCQGEVASGQGWYARMWDEKKTKYLKNQHKAWQANLPVERIPFKDVRNKSVKDQSIWFYLSLQWCSWSWHSCVVVVVVWFNHLHSLSYFIRCELRIREHRN